MGKAIVIDGLQVTNPLCTVTFSGTPAENAISAYLAANTSININEKEALGNFVEGLINANLWDKIKYFYPLLGDNVADAVLEVVSPSTEDLFVDNTSGLSVSSRKLIANNRPDSEVNTSTRAQALDISKIGMILAGGSNIDATQAARFLVNYSIANAVGLSISKDTYKYPLFENKTQIFEMPSDVYSKVKREVFGTTVSGVGYLYDGTTQLATGSLDIPTGTLKSSFGILSNSRALDYEYDFFAITEGMTTADWLVFHPLLMTFLQAVGKRAEL